MSMYAPGVHTGDRLAALLIATEAIRAHEARPKAGYVPTHTIPALARRGL
jgi:hypothetical protein